MVRRASSFLGIVLLAMFALGLGASSDSSWLMWLDLVAAIGAFIIALVATPSGGRGIKVGAPIALSVGLFVMWLFSLGADDVAGWLKWFNFAVAAAFLLTGILGGFDVEAGEGSTTAPMRRSA